MMIELVQLLDLDNSTFVTGAALAMAGERMVRGLGVLGGRGEAEGRWERSRDRGGEKLGATAARCREEGGFWDRLLVEDIFIHGWLMICCRLGLSWGVMDMQHPTNERLCLWRIREPLVTTAHQIITHKHPLSLSYRVIWVLGSRDLSSDDLVVLFKGYVSLEHIKQQYTQWPDSGWDSMVAVLGQPLRWTIHSCT